MYVRRHILFSFYDYCNFPEMTHGVRYYVADHIFSGVSKLYCRHKETSCSDALFEVCYLFGLGHSGDVWPGKIEIPSCLWFCAVPPSHCRKCACTNCRGGCTCWVVPPGPGDPGGTIYWASANKVWQYELKVMIVKLVIFTYMTTAFLFLCLISCQGKHRTSPLIPSDQCLL